MYMNEIDSIIWVNAVLLFEILLVVPIKSLNMTMRKVHEDPPLD